MCQEFNNDTFTPKYGDEIMQYPKLKKTLEYLVDEWGPIEQTRLLKIVYLADRQWQNDYGITYTEAHYYRWNHGPFSQEILEALEWMDGIELIEKIQKYNAKKIYTYEYGKRTRLTNVKLDSSFVAILDKMANHWIQKPLKKLLDYVYSDHAFKKTNFGDPLLRTTSSSLHITRYIFHSTCKKVKPITRKIIGLLEGMTLAS